VSLPVPTTQHSRNRWLASSVEDPKAVTALKAISKYKNQFGPTPIPSWDTERIARFFRSQTGASDLETFEAQVINYFHSKTGEYSSWDNKYIFGEAVTSSRECDSEQNKCTLIAYLFMFTETPSGKPSLALRLNSGIEGADGIIFATRSPIGAGVYDKRVTVRFSQSD
jgi:hypothetical protein